MRTARAFCQNEENIGRCEWGLVTNVLKGLDRRAAEEEPDHAPDISEERAQEILDTVTDVEIQFIIWLMLNTGARVKDLLRLKHHQLFIHGNRVYVEFKVTKVATTPKSLRLVYKQVAAFDRVPGNYVQLPSSVHKQSDRPFYGKRYR